jgi:hypothetical protein
MNKLRDKASSQEGFLVASVEGPLRYKVRRGPDEDNDEQ